MPFFSLFKVSKNENYHDLNKELSQFGKINFFKLNPDKDDKELQFGQLDFFECDSNKIHEYFLKKNIKFKEQPSRNQQIQTVKPSEKKEFKQVKTDNFSTVSNPSFHYYKDESYGKNIESFKLTNNFSELYDLNLPLDQTFELTTIYPGLLIGSGYNHPKLKDDKNDFQLGFFFDHTTGLPIISGSSIKGMLRSVFKETKFLKDVYSNYYKDHMNIDVFEKGQIIFYDAYIVSSQNQNNKIFASDYITNHFSSEDNGMFKEPNPIKFLKVLPAVSFKFQFKSADEELLSKNVLNEYIELFKQIILDFGLGAKTNVGYGKFQE